MWGKLMKIQNDAHALSVALILAITAKDNKDAGKASKLAIEIANRMKPEDVEKVKDLTIKVLCE